MPFNIAFAVVLLGVAYAILTLKLQRRLTNPHKMKEIQGRISRLTKEMNEMTKRNENISAKQAELMPLMRESMQGQMKAMFVVLPLFLVVYYGLLPLMFNQFAAEDFTFIVPLSYSSLFIVTAIIFGLVMSVGILISDKVKPKPGQAPDTNNVK